MSGWLRRSGSRAAGSSRAELGDGLGLADQGDRGLVAGLPAMRERGGGIEIPLLGSYREADGER
jgi:hypothetical protein